MKCPICNEELEVKEYEGEFGLEEEIHRCPNECYGYHFAFGNYEWKIDGVLLGYSYNDSQERKELVSKQKKALIKISKESK